MKYKVVQAKMIALQKPVNEIIDYWVQNVSKGFCSKLLILLMAWCNISNSKWYDVRCPGDILLWGIEMTAQNEIFHR